jgi:hypothetical protein
VESAYKRFHHISIVTAMSARENLNALRLYRSSRSPTGAIKKYEKALQWRLQFVAMDWLYHNMLITVTLERTPINKVSVASRLSFDSNEDTSE